MIRASTLFKQHDRQAINAAVATAEKTTRGEIVPVVATVSGRYDRAEDLFGLLLAVLGLCAWWALKRCAAAAAWDTGPTTLTDLLTLVAIVVAGFVLGAALASRQPWLCAPFIARREMQEEVERRALEIFQRQRLRATAAGTGVLIYVSLFEHMVRVVGDETINARVQSGDWEAICARVVEGMRAGQAARGLEQAIALAGELLARHFPADQSDRNELSDTLLLID